MTVKVSERAVEPMSAAISNHAILAEPVFPAGVDAHLETQRHSVWNKQEHTSEEHQFVYEISWIEQLGLWRTFLRSHHKVEG